MKQIYYLLATALLLAACSKESLAPEGKPLPPQGMAEVTPGEIRLSNDMDQSAARTIAGATFGASARASQKLPDGATLRLYAFKPDVPPIFQDLISTRTYTVDAQGTPQLDADQDPLYLPVGKVDIYLVGPVNHNTGTSVAPVIKQVAREDGIYPLQGADLIAAHTQATITAGKTNLLPAMELTHKMARAQVVIEPHPQAVYENLVVTEIKFYAQPTRASYTLDNTGGTITSPATMQDFTVTPVVEETQYQRYSGTTVLIPQPEKKLKIETTFECNQQNQPGDPVHPTIKYRQTGLIDATLAATTATRFTAQPLTPVEIKWRATVLPWNSVDQETILVPDQNTDYVAINGLGWAKGNLVATSDSTCAVGGYADYGVYFLFGSLIGWTGGEDGSGIGNGGPKLDIRVWPLEMGSTKPSIELPGNDKTGENISTLDDYFFNYSMSPWNADDPSSNIGTFNLPMDGDAGQGTLSSGRYAKLGVGDPCTYYLGSPWRLPTQNEMLAFSKATSVWSPGNGVNGRWFPNIVNNLDKAIFIPAAGHRYAVSGNFHALGSEARQITSSTKSATSIYYLYINSSKVISPDQCGRNGACVARCVRPL